MRKRQNRKGEEWTNTFTMTLSSTVHSTHGGKDHILTIYVSPTPTKTLSCSLISPSTLSFLIRKHSCCPAVVSLLGRPVFIKRKPESCWVEKNCSEIWKVQMKSLTRKWLEKWNTVGLKMLIAWHEWYLESCKFSQANLRFFFTSVSHPSDLCNQSTLPKINPQYNAADERKETNTSVKWQKNVWREIWFITKVTKETPQALDISSRHYYRLIRGAFKAGSNYEEWLGLIRRQAQRFKYSECQNIHFGLFRNVCNKQTKNNTFWYVSK